MRKDDRRQIENPGSSPVNGVDIECDDVFMCAGGGKYCTVNDNFTVS
jgi:hypothetical protein